MCLSLYNVNVQITDSYTCIILYREVLLIRPLVKSGLNGEQVSLMTPICIENSILVHVLKSGLNSKGGLYSRTLLN